MSHKKIQIKYDSRYLWIEGMRNRDHYQCALPDAVPFKRKQIKILRMLFDHKSWREIRKKLHVSFNLISETKKTVIRDYPKLRHKIRGA